MATEQAAPGALAELTAEWASLIDSHLDRLLSEQTECPARLAEAMRYGLFSGGKRLRPLVVLMACEACRGPIDRALPAAAAVEMIHAYSLIHDDLPAMDDDDFRRGLPTCHKQFDEATAILAGDALLTLAFDSLAAIEPPSTAIRCVRELAVAAGTAGMVGGQSDDLNAATGPGSLEWLESLHARKTGALLLASLRMGGLVAGANAAQLAGLDEYGRCVGLAFQIVDDLLDAEGDREKVGKDVRKDEAAGKLTYPGLLGIEESRRRARDLAAAARRALAPFGPAGRYLARLADYVVERDR